jgi:hypothetical protein
MRWTLSALCLLISLGSAAAEEEPTVSIEAPPPELLESRRLYANIDFGVSAFGKTQPLHPSGSFGNRAQLFPIPTVSDLTGFTTRFELGYNIGVSPWTLNASWEHHTAGVLSELLGFDALQAPYLAELNRFRRDLDREDNPRGNNVPDELLRPALMRAVPSDAHVLRSRTTAHLVDVAAMYSLLPSEQRWLLIPRIVLGARYGGFFSEDRATGVHYEQSAGNWFAGIGPLVGARIDAISNVMKNRGVPTLYLDVRGGALFGDSRVRYREIDTLFHGTGPAFREKIETSFRSVPYLNLETGLGLQGNFVRWTIGYRLQYAWGVARTGHTERDFSSHSIFFRAEVGF